MLTNNKSNSDSFKVWIACEKLVSELITSFTNHSPLVNSELLAGSLFKRFSLWQKPARQMVRCALWSLEQQSNEWVARLLGLMLQSWWLPIHNNFDTFGKEQSPNHALMGIEEKQWQRQQQQQNSNWCRCYGVFFDVFPFCTNCLLISGRVHTV